MTEIEKMFENAGIKGEWRDYRTKNGKIYEGKNPKNRNIRLCKPDFTAEKQLELIKWLIVHSPNTCLEDVIIVSAFEDSLANVINNLWQSFNDQEKEEIRNILNA